MGNPAPSLMPDTYTQLYTHIVFAVKFRTALLQPEWEEPLRLYITAIVQNNGHKMLAINNMPDHLHLLVGLNPAQSLSDLMRLVKGDSSEWINKEKLTQSGFRWQEGYGAFSYSRSQVDAVAKYIHNQKEHHRKTSFGQEYRQMLTSFGIDYDEQYLFKEPVE